MYQYTIKLRARYPSAKKGHSRLGVINAKILSGTKLLAEDIIDLCLDQAISEDTFISYVPYVTTTFLYFDLQEVPGTIQDIFISEFIFEDLGSGKKQLFEDLGSGEKQ